MELKEDDAIIATTESNAERPTEDLKQSKTLYVKVCRFCGKLANINEGICGCCGNEWLDIIDTEQKISYEYINRITESGESLFSVEIYSKDHLLKKYPLPLGVSLFGRSLISDFESEIEKVNYISEIHCLLVTDEGTSILNDTSLNGVYENGERLTKEIEITSNLRIDLLKDKSLYMVFKRSNI